MVHGIHVYVQVHTIFLFFSQEIQFLNHVCSSTQQSILISLEQKNSLNNSIYTWYKQHEWGKGGYNIAKPDKNNVFCYLFSNQVSSIEHHLKARNRWVKKLMIQKIEELHLKQKKSIWKQKTSEAADEQ
jgi:hypothetical protein